MKRKPIQISNSVKIGTVIHEYLFFILVSLVASSGIGVAMDISYEIYYKLPASHICSIGLFLFTLCTIILGILCLWLQPYIIKIKTLWKQRKNPPE